jgi:hypothetical protein
MIKEDKTVKFTRHCSDCKSYQGLSKDTLGRILCSDEQCALYYEHYGEFIEEKNHELTSPSFYGIQCQWFVERQ